MLNYRAIQNTQHGCFICRTETVYINFSASALDMNLNMFPPQTVQVPFAEYRLFFSVTWTFFIGCIVGLLLPSSPWVRHFIHRPCNSLIDVVLLSSNRYILTHKRFSQVIHINRVFLVLLYFLTATTITAYCNFQRFNIKITYTQ